MYGSLPSYVLVKVAMDPTSGVPTAPNFPAPPSFSPRTVDAREPLGVALCDPCAFAAWRARARADASVIVPVAVRVVDATAAVALPTRGAFAPEEAEDFLD